MSPEASHAHNTLTRRAAEFLSLTWNLLHFDHNETCVNLAKLLDAHKLAEQLVLDVRELSKCVTPPVGFHAEPMDDVVDP